MFEEGKEFDIESALDLESNAEFGYPNLDTSNAGSTDSLVLRDWSAQDFANIFVEFRPHLERHAKRYVSSTFLAEEIVQEAFLYLMTALPDIDDREGVLKFLKWKVKLLALDSHRSAYARRERHMSDSFDISDGETDISEDLERAEDSAVIRMALSQLSPRHRFALLANVYEERSAESIGEDLGLSPNSTRQLIFRARRAFRKALVGEAEIRGRSASQILSIAAKKLSVDAASHAGKLSAFVAVLALAAGYSQLPVGPAPEQLANVIQAEVSGSDEESLTSRANANREVDRVPQSVQIEAGELEGLIDEDLNSEELQSEGDFLNDIPDVVQAAGVGSQISSDQSGTEVRPSNPTSFGPFLADDVLSTKISEAGIYKNTLPGFFDETFSGEVFEIFGGTGVSAFVNFQAETKTVSNALFHIWADNQRYAGVPGRLSAQTVLTADGYKLVMEATEFYVVDVNGAVFEDSRLSDASASVIISLDEILNPVAASLEVKNLSDVT